VLSRLVTATALDTSRSRLDTRALVAFFGLAYLLSWAWAVPSALRGEVIHRGDGWPTHLPSLFGPLVAAFLVTAWTVGRAGVADLWRRMVRWRVPARWWLSAVSPLAFLAVALVAERLAGDPWPRAAAFGRFTGMPAVGVIGVFLLVTLAAFGEETGWRGYALPQLQRRFSPLTATLILAPLWALWHAPQFFVVATYRNFGVGDCVGFLIGLTCGAVVLTWLYNRSGGSILIVAVWHGIYNLVGGGTDAAVGTISAVVSTLVMVQGVTLAGLELRARRRGRPSIIGPH